MYNTLLGKGIVFFACNFVQGEKKKSLIEKGLQLMVNYDEIFIIPEGLTEISDNLFKNCKNLKSVIISGSVKIIGAHAFENCEKLEVVVILNGVKTIGEKAFENCGRLKSIKIPDSIESIGYHTSCVSETGEMIFNRTLDSKASSRRR